METPPLPPEPSSSGISDRQWAVLLHLSAFSGFILPFGHILGPLLIWLLRKPVTPSLDPIGREVLNFQISYSIYLAVATLSIFVLVGFLLLPILGLAWLILMIVGAVKASNGEFYRFPLTIRML